MANLTRLVLCLGLFLFVGNLSVSFAQTDSKIVKEWKVQSDHYVAILDAVSPDMNPYEIVFERIVLEDELVDGVTSKIEPRTNSPPVYNIC